MDWTVAYDLVAGWSRAFIAPSVMNSYRGLSSLTASCASSGHQRPPAAHRSTYHRPPPFSLVLRTLAHLLHTHLFLRGLAGASYSEIFNVLPYELIATWTAWMSRFWVFCEPYSRQISSGCPRLLLCLSRSDETFISAFRAIAIGRSCEHVNF